jgi:hypothetical protein
MANIDIVGIIGPDKTAVEKSARFIASPGSHSNLLNGVVVLAIRQFIDNVGPHGHQILKLVQNPYLVGLHQLC